MGVPSGDQRDWMFATKYGIPKILTLQPKDRELKLEEMTEAYTDKDGVLVNSAQFTGMEMHAAMKGIMDYAEEKAIRRMQVAFPEYEIIGINCRSLIIQHGSLHCCTMQFPLFTS